ncbi:MAG: 50S ribosomal protein L9 [bacterium]|nr:50S ribosomal protein L9 [bacterium]
MKILLNENIDNLGKLGDIVEVKPGYARNYLLPKEMAILPNKHNLEVMKYKKIKALKQLELDKLSAVEQKKRLEEVVLKIEKKAGENETLFGSVTAMELEKKLAELGFEVERKKFQLAEPIKKLGNYTLTIKLIEDITADIKIEVTPEGGVLEKTEVDVVEETGIEEVPAEDVVETEDVEAEEVAE